MRIGTITVGLPYSSTERYYDWKKESSTHHTEVVDEDEESIDDVDEADVDDSNDDG